MILARRKGFTTGALNSWICSQRNTRNQKEGKPRCGERAMGEIVPNVNARIYYNCLDCPAYCCSVYERVQVTPRDVNRLAKHFGLDYETAQVRFTRTYKDERI